MDQPRSDDEQEYGGPPGWEEFFADCLRLLTEAGYPFLVSGTFALAHHTGIVRPTKDLDVFCKSGDYPRFLSSFQEQGYRTEVEDERWIAKVFKSEKYIDIIFNVSSAVVPVTDEWFAHAPQTQLFGLNVRVTPATEFIWSKMFMQYRDRYDGADVAHIILKKHEEIDWQRLLSGVELYWEVLLMHLINFRFVYPSERELVPRWLFDELIGRLQAQADVPPSTVRMCRGRLLSPADYLVDVNDWGFADMIGRAGSAQYG
ncbi:MAG TPA: nucleotidyltransferase [Sphingomicrobium sp.]